MTNQKIRARDELIEFTKNELGFDFRKANPKEQSLAATKFYVMKIYNQMSSSIPEEELDSAIVDGAYDLGCDLIYRDNNKVTIIQTKYRSQNTPESAADIASFQNIITRLRNPEMRPNTQLFDILGDIKWKTDTFEFIFVTFGELKGQVLAETRNEPTYPNSLKDLSERSTWRYLDNEALNVEYRNIAAIRRGNSIDKEIEIYPVGQKGKRGSQAVVEVTAGKYRSFIMSLDARQLTQAYNKLDKDGIFSLNIRNYIGNTPINKGIQESAKADEDQFFLYNNGISCLATNVELEENCLRVRGLQIINGAQTVKSLVRLEHEHNRTGEPLWAQTTPKVLVRITEIPEGYGAGGRVREKIIKSNNTQNTIKDSDFRSNDEVQENLKMQFAKLVRKKKHAAYIPKRTDSPDKNKENVRLEEFAKAVYSFSYDPTHFSGNSEFLYKDTDPKDGYRCVFGDENSIWTKMPDDEFRYRAAIFWISQEIASNLKAYRDKARDADEKMALERKWLIIYAAKIVIETDLKPGETLKGVVSKFSDGDWEINGADAKSSQITKVFEHACKGVSFAYKNAKKANPNSFNHRNWMRGSQTTTAIADDIRTLKAYR
jgi:hypothetical protein